AEPQVTLFEGDLLRAALLLPERFPAGLPQFRWIAVAQGCPILLDFLDGVGGLLRECSGGRCQEYGKCASLHRIPSGYAMVASSVLLSPWLSVHVMTTLSPGFPPAKRKDRNGFFATAGPHSADNTVLPLHVALTFWMNQAGITAPLLSLRWPVSI